jgi:MerR family redox-sensitive transcriptional activator SoxR
MAEHATRLDELSVGDVARRSGLAVSAIHFYENEGLDPQPAQRRQPAPLWREVLRRVAIIKVAQRTGIPLKTIREAFKALPAERTPTAADWAKLSSLWKAELERRIDRLTRLRDHLTDCIGCGCLSVKSCPLHNPWDRWPSRGRGRACSIPIERFGEHASARA